VATYLQTTTQYPSESFSSTNVCNVDNRFRTLYNIIIIKNIRYGVQKNKQLLSMPSRETNDSQKQIPSLKIENKMITFSTPEKLLLLKSFLAAALWFFPSSVNPFSGDTGRVAGFCIHK
jgi:hypothetical protein